jgi:predicted N-acetyltransferase YhbS
MAMLAVSEETDVDYELTARIATEAFASDHVRFSADRIKWLYERGFGRGATVLAATDGGTKIGQVALINQNVCVNGEVHAGIQLVDLFILQTYRSSQLVRRLYREVERLCSERNIRFILALPNDKSVLLNARILKLEPALSLPIRAGLSWRRPATAGLHHSGPFRSLSKDQALALFSPFASPAGNGLSWDGESLFARLSDPTHDYAVHATDNVLLISSSRKSAGIGYTALCAFFARPGASIAAAEVSNLVAEACRFWTRPLFVYAGANSALPKLPGAPLPARLRRPILVQLRDTRADGQALRLDRFQLIDSDFA